VERRTLRFVEGQIYEGEVTGIGAAESPQRWISVAPFKKPALHSISDPLDLHYMPVCVASRLVAEGQLRMVDCQPQHPVVRLQHCKEHLQIRDTHLGVSDNNLERMLTLLRDSVQRRDDYADYAAGEILAMLKSARYRYLDVDPIEATVRALLARQSISAHSQELASWPCAVLWRAEIVA
jgi:hypothetical protein